MLFLAKDLEASRVNLLMNDFAAGLPSPLAFLGLGEVIGRALRAGQWSVSVLPVLHAVSVFEGRTKAEAAPTRDPNVFAPIEIPEDLVGSVEVSLLLDVPGCSDEHAVAEALVGRRIAGGPIHNADIAVERVTPPDGSAFSKMRRGYALTRATRPEAAVIATGAIDDLKSLAAKLYPAEHEPGSGWFVPVAVGHRLLEDPEKVPRRANTRDPTIQHVFVEPAVGIAELVSVRNRRLTGLREPELRDLLWRWKAEGDWIVGHSNYHPCNHTVSTQEGING